MRATIGQYEIRYELGSGGFGIVYAAVDVELGRWVAIKELRREISANPALVERFRGEAISLARLNHPNITALYHLLHPADEWFLVMELVQGQTLDRILHQLHRLDVIEVLAIIVQTAAGLGYANRMGVIHRDVKPSNLMLTDAGQVKIMDFGIARIQGTQRLTRSGLLGTYAYLAPEQFRGGEGTERSDLYALACVAYEMLSGKIPFDAPTEAEMMRGHLEMPPRSLRDILPDLNPQVDAAVQRALSKDPAARFASVEEFSDALGAGSIERQAQEIVRSRVLSRMPPPSRPTTLSDLSPGVADPNASAGSSAIWAGTAPDLNAKSGLSRRMPAIVLGAAATGVVVAALAVVFQDRLTTEPLPPQRASVVTSPNPHPAQPDKNVTPFNVQRDVDRGVPVDPRDTVTPKKSEIFIDSPHPSQSVKSLFLGSDQSKSQGSQAETADALIRQADDLISAGHISDAEVKLRTVSQPPYDDPRAWVKLAHLYDPTQPGRSDTTPANSRQAAYYYHEAEERNDASARADRDRLCRSLQEQADHHGDIDALATLRRFCQ